MIRSIFIVFVCLYSLSGCSNTKTISYFLKNADHYYGKMIDVVGVIRSSDDGIFLYVDSESSKRVMLSIKTELYNGLGDLRDAGKKVDVKGVLMPHEYKEKSGEIFFYPTRIQVLSVKRSNGSE